MDEAVMTWRLACSVAMATVVAHTGAAHADAEWVGRAFVGIHAGGGGDLRLADERLTIAADVFTLLVPPFGTEGLSGNVFAQSTFAVRLLGDFHRSLSLRGGYLLGRVSYDSGEPEPDPNFTERDTQHSFDAGALLRLRSRTGVTLAMFGGFERLIRANGLQFRDDRLPATGAGAVAEVQALWPLSPALGVWAIAGTRTGPHIGSWGNMYVAALGLAIGQVRPGGGDR